MPTADPHVELRIVGSVLARRRRFVEALTLTVGIGDNAAREDRAVHSQEHAAAIDRRNGLASERPQADALLLRHFLQVREGDQRARRIGRNEPLVDNEATVFDVSHLTQLRALEHVELGRPVVGLAEGERRLERSRGGVQLRSAIEADEGAARLVEREQRPGGRRVGALVLARRQGDQLPVGRGHILEQRLFDPARLAAQARVRARSAVADNVDPLVEDQDADARDAEPILVTPTKREPAATHETARDLVGDFVRFEIVLPHVRALVAPPLTTNGDEAVASRVEPERATVLLILPDGIGSGQADELTRLCVDAVKSLRAAFLPLDV